jgi:hypothetical protein
MIGIVATALLHSLLFAVAVWGGSGQARLPRPPDAIGAGANSGNEDGELGERRITVMLTPESQSTPSIEVVPQLPDPTLMQPSVVAITGLDALPLPPINADLSGEEAADRDAEMMARVKFAGIYESQVRARIERAWELPSDSNDEAAFSCLVLIHQNRDGRVREVELVSAKCEGSPATQMSLVRAIQAASPLPAPPHPSVFVDRFSLVLRASAVNPPRAVAQN